MNVICVPNRSGRQLNRNRGTMDMLAEIVDAMRCRAELVVRGSVQRGSGVALGAKELALEIGDRAKERVGLRKVQAVFAQECRSVSADPLRPRRRGRIAHRGADDEPQA